MAERLNFDNRGLQTGLDVAGIAADFELQLITNRRRVFTNAIASGDFKTGVYNQLNAYNDASRDAALLAFRKLTEVTSEHLQATHKAGKDTIDAGVKRFGRAGYKPNLQPVQRDKTTLTTFLGITLGAFLGAITQAQSAAQNQMMQITQLVRPGEDPRQEIDRVQGVFLQRGITVPSGGAEKALPSYVEFTERNQSQKLLLAAEGERAEEYGLHYSQISGRPSSCPKCTPWQLKVVIDDVFQSGKPDGKTPLMSQAINEGLFHFNCRHERTVFIPGFDKERLQAKDVASPKETATRYAIEQMQRYNERGIREWKMREAAAMTDTERRLAEMKVREWQAKQHALRKIAKEEGVPFYRQYSREQIGGDTAPTIKPEVAEYLTKNEKIVSIGVTGGTTLQKKLSEEVKAVEMYDSIRKTDKDVKRISKTTGISEETVAEVKRYLFIDKHNIDGKLRRFDESYEQAISWNRLASGKNIKEYDLLLVRHEVYEIELIKQGFTRDKAHIEATKRYNFNEAVNSRGDKKW